METLSVKLPDIGEGVTQAEIVEWHVAIGDTIDEDATLVSVMTDKATVDIPSLYGGTVRWIAGDVGDTLAIGAVLARIDTDNGAIGEQQPSVDQSSQDTTIKLAEVRATADEPAAANGSRSLHVLPVRLPDVGEGVTEAELVEWHVQVGDTVREDDVLAAVMTDKATVEIPSLYTGKVTALGGQIGEVVAVGANLLLIETTDGLANEVASRILAAPSKDETFELKRLAKEPGPTTNASSRPIQARPPRMEGTEVLASPSVRARARDGGIDLRQVSGSGPAGRISHSDLDELFAIPAGPSMSLRSESARRARTGVEDIKVVGMRRKIAERMALANSRIPHITVIEEVDVTAVEDLREKLNAGRGERPKLTVLPFVTAVLARAFIDHPEMNAHFDDDVGVVSRHEAVHLGIATMTDVGLVVPVFRHAEAAGLFETATEISRLSSVARTGKASRGELSGSTFTITSLGPLGAIATTPIINHPEVAILGINKMAVRPMWDGTRFQPRKMMNISASFDHRVIDGMDAALFVQKVKSLLETPALIFVDL